MFQRGVILNVGLLLGLLFVIAEGYQSYQNKIPNGDKVPNPCAPGEIWTGVGHEVAQGGGNRNPFGLAFKDNNLIWDEAFCKADADGDGRTNGQELGDDNCQWSENNHDGIRTDDITHPGICEPRESTECKAKNSWLSNAMCPESVPCTAVNGPDVYNATFRMMRTEVPAMTGQHFCTIHELPDIVKFEAYDIIAGIPIIGSENVLSHISIFGCNESDVTIDATDKPFPCGVGESKKGCNQLLATWGKGHENFCLHPDLGIRVVKGINRKLLFQFRLNNPDSRTGLFDDSGMTLFYTPNLRNYSSAMVMVGQQYLLIPPGGNAAMFTGGCLGDCSKMEMKGPIHIVSAVFYMRSLGIHGKLTVKRSDKEHVLVHDAFDYKDPTLHHLSQPFEVLPGDDILTTCTYKSTGRTEKTYWGFQDKDEMCYSFLRYYPDSNLQITSAAGCSSWKTLPLCKLYTTEQYVLDGCNKNDFVYNASNTDRLTIFESVIKNCPPSGACLPGCEEARVTAGHHPCLQGHIGDFIRSQELAIGHGQHGVEFLKSMDVVCKAPSGSDQVFKSNVFYFVVCNVYLFFIVLYL